MKTNNVSFTGGIKINGSYKELKKIAEKLESNDGCFTRFVTLGSPDKKVNTLGVANGEDVFELKSHFKIIQSGGTLRLLPAEDKIQLFWNKFKEISVGEFKKIVESGQSIFDKGKK